MTTSEPAGRPRFPWALTIVAVPALILLIGLGVWQVQRLQWKEGLIDRADAAAEMAPVPVSQLKPGPDREFRQVTIDCPGLATAPFVELQSILDGEAGVRLISACEEQAAPGRAEAGVLLIDRGFVAETVTARPPVTDERQPPVAFANNHLGYALTWFGLALALIGFYIALVRRKLKS